MVSAYNNQANTVADRAVAEVDRATVVEDTASADTCGGVAAGGGGVHLLSVRGAAAQNEEAAAGRIVRKDAAVADAGPDHHSVNGLRVCADHSFGDCREHVGVYRVRPASGQRSHDDQRFLRKVLQKI